MDLNNFFQKGYYINLDRRTDRRKEFESEMSKYGMLDFFERVSAEDSIMEPNPIIKHAYCALTYHKLFKKILDDGYENVVIFEDDAYFYNGGNRPSIDILNSALDELKDFNWDIFYFGGHPGNILEIVSDNLGICSHVLTTHAVAYKRHVMERVVKEYVPFSDSAIDGWLTARDGIKKFITTELAIPQRNGNSDLDASGRSAGVEVFLESYRTVNRIDIRNVNK
jgi:GR25 family glycosyltransferase involved in LPS biosynthesis